MGFSSLNDFLSEISANGKFFRADFMQSSGGAAYTAARWYDFSIFDGSPPTSVHGDYVTNGGFWGSAVGWTLGSAQWAYTPATGLVTRTVGGSQDTISQNTNCVNGTTYSVAYTIGSVSGSGNIQISLGGTAGTLRTANGTYRENIVCGATAGAPVTITVDAARGCTIDNVSVIEELAFFPYTDHGLYHGGNVSTDTKHLVNFGAWCNAATGAPSVLMLVDMLGVYPRINLNTSSLQTLINTATLPRYTSGAGVRAFVMASEAPGATGVYFNMSYTNPVPTSGRGLGAAVAFVGSAIAGHILHSGAAALSYFGPFLPLAAGDTGVKSVESVQLSAAMTTGGIGNLVLCRPIASIPITTAFVASERDLMNQLPSLPKIEDGASLFFLLFAGAAVAANTQFQGYCDFAWG